jgi:predicted PolB exonuclease-like 3'-5' exonuclease
MILAGDIYRDSRRRNKLIADWFRSFQAKQPLMDGTLESSEMAPKKKNTLKVLKLSGKYTERYEG